MFDADRFWLLTSDAPTGPFSAAEIHAQLAAGAIGWEARVCPLGSGVWRALVETPGFGPTASARENRIDEPPRELPAPAPLPSAPRPVAPISAADPVGPAIAVPDGITSDSGQEKAAPGSKAISQLLGIALGVGIAVAIVYGAYELIRPNTATEVCKKLDACKTAEEAKKLATPRFHPVIDVMFAEKATADPNDTFEFTQEVDGPQPNTKLVGMKGTMYIQELGRRAQIEGHVAMMKTDGWKIDDLVFTGVEGMSLPGRYSLVEELRQQKADQSTQSGGAKFSAPKSPAPAKRSDQNWFVRHGLNENKVQLRLLFFAAMLVIAAIKGAMKRA